MSSAEFGEDQEFPRFDERRTGTDVRYLYTAGRTTSEDPFAFRALLRHDRHGDKEEARTVEARQTVAEPVFVPRAGSDDEEAGWLLQLGYDGERDRTFLDIVDAASLERAARVWTVSHFPLGFHGNFTREHFVAAPS